MMTKTLTAFQLISNTKKLLPRGQKRGGEIITYLIMAGYIYKLGEHQYSLCPGKHPTLKDVEAIAKNIDPKAKTFTN